MYEPQNKKDCIYSYISAYIESAVQLQLRTGDPHLGGVLGKLPPLEPSVNKPVRFPGNGKRRIHPANI